MLVYYFFGLVLLARGLFRSLDVFGRFVGWFWFEKICSTSPPRGNQVDGLPRASSFEPQNIECSKSDHLLELI